VLRAAHDGRRDQRTTAQSVKHTEDSRKSSEVYSNTSETTDTDVLSAAKGAEEG
jgi:hypothetical protein